MTKNIPVSYKNKKKAHISNVEEYESIYNQSITDTDNFWSQTAARIAWVKKWDKVSNVNLSTINLK